MAVSVAEIMARAGPGAFANDFDIFRKAEELLGRCRRHDLAIPDGYTDHLPVLGAGKADPQGRSRPTRCTACGRATRPIVRPARRRARHPPGHPASRFSRTP